MRLSPDLKILLFMLITITTVAMYLLQYNPRRDNPESVRYGMTMQDAPGEGYMSPADRREWLRDHAEE